MKKHDEDADAYRQAYDSLGANLGGLVVLGVEIPDETRL